MNEWNNHGVNMSVILGLQLCQKDKPKRQPDLLAAHLIIVQSSIWIARAGSPPEGGN